ncbi:MAG: ABC transporter permease [Marinoscillum sp.]
MSALLNIPWILVLILSIILQGGFLLIALLINKYPASRFLGIITALLLITASLPFLLPDNHSVFCLIVMGQAFTIHSYAQAFFTQKTRISYLLAIPVIMIGSGLFILEGIWFDAIQFILYPLFIAYCLRSAFLFIKREGQVRGIQWIVNPGSRLIWFRNFFTYECVLIGVLTASSVGWVPQIFTLFGIMVHIYFIVFQLFRESDFFDPIPVTNKYQKSTLTPAQKSDILSKLNKLIEVEKFYLESTTSLSSLAKKLNTTTHHLSQVLNETKGMSFQELLSQYRIREAKVILKSNKHESTKIEHVASMVGYNSKSSFNTAFKKYTNLTPKEYKEQKNVQTYREERPPNRGKPTSGIFGFDLMNRLNQNINQIMVSNFFKIFYRRVARNKVFTFINLFGLTVGFTCSILIYLFIGEHTSYDQELPQSNQIYRVAWVNENPQTRTPHPFAQRIKEDLPEVIQSTTLSPIYGPGLTRDGVRVENKKEDIQFIEKDFFYVDSTFLDVFDLKVLAGDPDALKKPWNVVISQSTAEKYFGNEDPIGQTITIDDWDIAVAAVVEDMPKRSHFHVTGLVSYVTLKNINPENLWFTWQDFGHFNYLKLAPGTDYKEIESKIPEWIVTYLDWSQTDKERLLNHEAAFKLQPIKDIHLHSHLRWELENNTNILYIYILTGAMVFILLIACINYINLTTAKSIERAREVGVRKTLGALSLSLTGQFYLESLVFCLVAAVLAFAFSAMLLPFFNHITQIQFSTIDLIRPGFLTAAGMAILVISMLSGSYPAMVMDKFKPVDVLKGKLTTSFHGRRLRNGLVIFQFFVSAILIIASLIILKQLNYMKTKELGFDQDALISVKMYPSAALGGMDVEMIRTLENEFSNVSGVKEVSAVSNLPGGQFDQLTIYQTIYPEEKIDASQMGVDYDALNTLGISMAEGRTFDRSYDSDTLDNHFIINAEAASRLNLDDPIGVSITWEQAGRSGQGVIVGITNDFHFQSLHSAIQPLIIYLDPYDVNHIVVKMEGREFQNTLNQINAIYAQNIMDIPFEYHFIDEQLAELYNDEIRTLNIFTIFTSIALILACIGLIGLAIALLNQSIKDIGIRKIMGARSWDIFSMVLLQFLKLIGIALLFGLPVGYLIMQVWIQEFSYQATIGVLPFVVSACTLVIISIMSVSVIIVKIASTNPAETLRYE